MPAGEVIVGAITEFFGYILLEVIIKGIGKGVRTIYYVLRKWITGKEREISELERIEKRILFKKFRLKSDFSQHIPKGTRGTVMEVIDEQYLFIEFEDADGNPILEDDEMVFKIERKKIRLEKADKTN